MLYRLWNSIGGRELLQITVAGDSSSTTEQESKAAIAAAIREVEGAGLRPRDIVRTRVFGRDAQARTKASDARRADLTGDKRAASASFHDARRLPAGSTMMLDVIALRTGDAAANKIVEEYDQPVFAPLFVKLDGMVFLSGNTDTSPTLPAQLHKIRAKIEHGLRKADVAWSDIAQVSAFFARTQEPQALRRALDTAFPELNCPIALTDVVGFSAPEKLIEIEVTATASRRD